MSAVFKPPVGLSSPASATVKVAAALLTHQILAAAALSVPAGGLASAEGCSGKHEPSGADTSAYTTFTPIIVKHRHCEATINLAYAQQCASA